MSSINIPEADFILGELRKYAELKRETGQKIWTIRRIAEEMSFNEGHVSNFLRGKRVSDRFLGSAWEWIQAQKSASGAQGSPVGDDLRPEGVAEQPPEMETLQKAQDLVVGLTKTALPTAGKRLKWAREQLGYRNQDLFAEFLGHKNRGVVGNSEAGRPMSRAFLYELQEKAGISKEWMETGEGNWRTGRALPDPGELAHIIWAELGVVLRWEGLNEARLVEILGENPPMPSETPEDYGKRIIELMKGEFAPAGAAERGPAYGGFDLGRLVELVMGMDGGKKAKVMKYVERLAK